MSLVLALPTTPRPLYFAAAAPSRATAANVSNTPAHAGFERFLVEPHDSGHAVVLPQATVTRARLGGALRDFYGDYKSKSSSAFGKQSKLRRNDSTSVLRAVQEYLPYLVAIVNAIDHDSLAWSAMPTFAWRWKYLLNPDKSKTLDLASLHYELSACLYVLAAALANSATAVIASLGSYEHSVSTSDADRAKLDEKVNLAADILCKAAGVLEFLSAVQIPRWEEELRIGAKAIKSGACHSPNNEKWWRPPELSSELPLALSKIFLADAERLAIRKLKSRAAAHSALVPGESLPPSHPSPSLLAKLYLRVYNLYDEALSLVLVVSNSSNANAISRTLSSIANVSISSKVALKLQSRFKKSASSISGKSSKQSSRRRGIHIGKFSDSDSETDDLSESSDEVDDIVEGFDFQSLGYHSKLKGKDAARIRFYIERGRVLALALAYQWLGVDAAEAKSKNTDGSGNIGEAVGWLRLGDALLSSIRNKKKTKSDDDSSSKKPLSHVIQEEHTRLKEFLKEYEQINDRLTFQDVPSSEELLSKVPSGRNAVSIKPYKLPKPAFSPSRPPESVFDGMDDLSLRDAYNEGEYGESDEDSMDDERVPYF